MESAPVVVYLDDDLLVVDKPSGVLTIPDGYDSEKPHLKEILRPHYGKLWIVHRLDKSTSGLVILARNKDAHRKLNDQFSQHLVEKVYWAIVHGVPDWDRKEIDKPLRSNVGRRKRTIVDVVHGKPARTLFQVLRRFDRYALVEAQPETGRTHQIRAHLYSIGHPILGDPKYGNRDEPSITNRLALHARSITIGHPCSGERVTFIAPEGGNFVHLLKTLA